MAENTESPVEVTVGIDEDEQMSSLQNGTLQSFGDSFAVTIHTYVACPAGSSNFTQQEVADYIAELLHTANHRTNGQLTFEVAVGMSAEVAAMPAEYHPKLN